MKERTKVIVDDTTIYEVDLACAARATPRGRRWTKERVVGDADPYDGWQTGRVHGTD